MFIIFGWFVHDFLVMFSWFVSWFFHDLNVGTRSQPTPNLLCFVLIYLRFFVDFLLIFWVARGEAPKRGGEAMPRSQVAPADMFIEVASGVGKAVSFLLRISYIFHNFPLLLFRSPRFPFLLLQVYKNTKKPLKNKGFFDFWGSGRSTSFKSAQVLEKSLKFHEKSLNFLQNSIKFVYKLLIDF